MAIVVFIRQIIVNWLTFRTTARSNVSFSKSDSWRVEGDGGALLTVTMLSCSDVADSEKLLQLNIIMDLSESSDTNIW